MRKGAKFIMSPSIEFLLSRGYKLYLDGKYQEAIGFYKQVAQLDPRDWKKSL